MKFLGKFKILIFKILHSFIYLQKRPRSRSLSQLPDDCILACRKTSLLNDKQEDTAPNGSLTECSNDISDEKSKNKFSKSSRSDKSQVDSDTSDDERMVICEEDTNSGKKKMNFFVCLINISCFFFLKKSL